MKTKFLRRTCIKLKITMLGLVIMFSISKTFCQINEYSKPIQWQYQSPNYERILDIGRQKQMMYDRNLDYLNKLVKWIDELKTQSNEDNFLSDLDYYRKQLVSIYDEDLSLYSEFLGNLHKYINDAIANLNDRIEENRRLAEKKEKAQKATDLGYNCMNKNNFICAEESFKLALEIVPNYAGALYGIAKTYYYQGLMESSLKSLNTLISKYPQIADGYKLRGKVFNLMGNSNNAILDFTAALKINETSELYGLRGWVYYYQNLFDKALNDFDKQVDTDIENPVAYYNRGSAKAGLKDNIGAISDYKKAILLDPKFSMAYNNLGWSKFELKNYRGALIDLNKAVQLDPSNSIALDSRAETKFYLNDFAGCIKDCNTAISLNPKLSNSYYIRGRAKYMLNNKKGACIDWKMALELGSSAASDYVNKYCL